MMYMLLSKGKHPLYEPHDTEETYSEKLKNPEWDFPPTITKYDNRPMNNAYKLDTRKISFSNL